MKKNFKRWLAFLLAVVVIATTCIHSSDAFLWADEEDAPVTEPEETMQTLTVDSSDDAGSGGDESGDEQYSGDEESSEESDGEDSWEEEDSEDDAESDGSEDDGEDYGDGEDGSEGDAADSAEGSDGENADVADDGSAGEDVGGENTENSEDTDGSEEEEGFDYVICFYFDGTEDESTRISGTDGKPGESILGLVEIADKKEHDGKNYVLDRIENKDGVITEDAGSNVVSVYYVAEMEDEEPEEKYGYEIHFYYDGKEGDVEKGEGAPDREILSFATIEDKKEFNGKNYILDSIENKDGKIVKDTAKNVVNVYYILAEEDVKTYSLKFESNLSDGGKAEVVSVSPKDGMTGSLYKEGAKVTFEVSVNDGYELLTVENRDRELKAQSKKDNVYTYAVTMKEDMVISVTYEEEMPEQKLSASAGKVGVTIDVPEGVLPDGTIAEVQSVDSDDVADAIMAKLAEDELYPVEITAVDINLFKDGEPVSPKGDVTVTLENVFDASVSGKEAAVYHVNGGNAEYVGDADPASSDVTFDTNHFSVYAAVKAVPMDEIEDGIMTLDESDTIINRGNMGVPSGKDFSLKGEMEGYDEEKGKFSCSDHEWLYDTDVVECVKQSEESASFRYTGGEDGEKETVIRHTYKKVYGSKDKNNVEITENCTEIWRVQFTEGIENGTQRVYVYVHVGTGIESSEWPVNSQGWITVGYIDVPGIPLAAEAEENKYAEIQKQVEGKLGDLIKFGNIQFKLSEVTWEGERNNQKYGLKAAYGATDFTEADSGTLTWHLDGYVTLVPQTFNVEYYKDNETKPETKTVTKYIGINANEIPVGENDIVNPFGADYELDKIVIDEVEGRPETIEINGTICVYYKAKSQPCQVVYVLEGGEIAKEELDNIKQEYEENVLIGPDSITFKVKTDDPTPTIPDPKKTGYEFEGWTPEVVETVSGDTTYTAQYTRDKKGFKAAFADGKTVAYDTLSHKVEVKVEGGLAEEEKVFYQYDGNWYSEETMENNWPKNVGTYQIPVKVVDKNNDTVWETNGTDNHHPSIEITPCSVSILVDNDTQEYRRDGNYTFENVKVSYKGPASTTPLKSEIETELKGLGIDLSVERISKENKVGTYTKDLTLKNKDALDKYSNYSFTVDEGVFTITSNTAKEVLNVTLAGDEKTYNGKWHLVKATVLLDGKALGDGEYEIIYYDSDGNMVLPQEAGRKNAGESTFYCEVKVEGYENSAVSEKATVKIEPKEVEVQVTPTGKIYGADDPIGDNTSGYAGHSKIESEQLAENEGLFDFFTDGRGYFTITRLEEGENVGEYKLSITADELKRVSSNYKVIVKDGTFEIKGEVTYASNGAEGNPPQADKKEYSLNETITVLDKGGLTKANAVFLGWSTDANVGLITTQEALDALKESNSFYEPGAKLTMGLASITLYPVWAEDKDGNGKEDYKEYLYSLTYNRNGGEGDVPDGDDKYKAGQDVKLQQGDPEKLKKDGAVFVGWSSEKQEETFKSRPASGIVIDEVKFANSDITVYAVWAEDTKGPDGKFDGVADYLEKSVTFTTAIGTINDTADANRLYEVGKEVTVSAPQVSAPAKASNEIISFANQWKDIKAVTGQPSYDDSSITFIMPDSEVELMAQWKYLQIDKEIKDDSEDGYKADDPITFIITVRNVGNVDFEAVVKEDSKFTFADGKNTQALSVKAGEEAKLEVEYQVTEDDLRNTLSNTVTAEISGSVGEASFTKDVKLIGATKGLAVEKKIRAGSKDSYAEGDEITFEVHVTNTGSVTVTGINITDSFEEAKLEEANLLKRLAANVRALLSGKGWGDPDLKDFDLKPGEAKTVNVKYTISEEDVRNNASGAAFKNHVIAKGMANVSGTPEEVIGEDWSEEIVIAPLDEKLQLTKTVVTPDSKEVVDGKYPVGSSVKYRISVENLGNTTISGVVIDDSMVDEKGAPAAGTIGNVALERQVPGVTVEWEASGRKFEVSQIPRGETIAFTYEYKVDAKDAGKKITNTATIYSPEEQPVPSEPIEVVNKELTVEKRVDESKEEYKLGETVNYTVTVKNTGNVALSGIKVWDILEGGSSQAIPAEGQSDEIASLAVGDSQDFHYSYKIIEDDLENMLENKAVASVDDREFTSNLVQSKVEDKAETATLEKNITNLSEATGDNGRFKAGDTIHYEIKVENTGTRTLNNVVVTDTMTGMSGKISNVTGVKSYFQNGSEIRFEIDKIPSRGVDKDDNYTGHIATITYDYVVDAKDAGAEISNTAVISSYLDEKNGISDTETVTIEKKSLDVTKEIVAVRPGGEAGYEPADSSRSFDTGDTVRFAVKVKNDGNADLTNVTVTDTMSGENSPVADFVPGESDIDSQTIASLKAGEEVTLTYDYTVRPEDISSDIVLTNTAKATSGDVVSREAKVDVQRAGKASGYTVEKKIEPENPDRMYHVGETIPYSIEVLNTGNTTYLAGEVVVADVLTGDGEEIAVDADSINVTSGNATWNNGQFVLNVPLGWRERVRIDYTYKVAPADEGKELINTAYGSEMKQKDSTVPVTIEKKKLSVTKEVTSTPSNGEAYAVDEYISFKVTLKNDGNVPLEDILVTDHLWGSAGESVELPLLSDEGQNPFTDVISLGVNETKIYEYTYQVKESDARTRIWNEIDASIEEGNSEHGETQPVKIEDPDPKISLTKSILTPPDGEDGRYKTGTKITYEIRVKNTGNTTLENVTVKDTMAGATGRVAATSAVGARMTSALNEGKWEYTLEIAGEIARGEEKVITYDYVIQKEDAGKKIGNTVAVDGDDITTDPDSDDSEEIVVENRKLTVTKTIREPERVYKLGEEILFDVKVDNEGDVILYGIDLVDEMLGGAAGEAELVSGNASDIVLNPGVAVDLVYKYVVQPGDIANNALKNKLTATAEDNTKGEDETDYIKIEGQNPAFSIQKSVISTGSGENGKYAIGDTIDYEITITNDGNVALPSMTVADRMENASGAIIADSVKAVIDSGEGGETPVAVTWNKAAGKFELGASIPIGGKAVITYGYEVVEADAGKTIVNVAGKPTDPGSKETQTEIEDRRIIIDKLVTSTPANPARGYVAGERITFDVRVANPGNVSLSGISIADEMQNAFGAAILVDGNGNALNDNSDKNISLEAGENLVLHYSYEVTRDDIVAGGKEIVNKATAEPESGELRGTTEDTSRPVQVDRLHTLTVYYQYADGSTAVETLVQEFAYGDSFAFTIPAITGYTSTLEGNPVQQAVMFDSTLFNDEDPVFTIIYSAIPVTEPGTEPETEPTATPVPGGGEPEPEPDTPVPPVPPVPPVDDVPVPEAVIVPVAPAAVAAAPGILGGGAGLVAIGDEPVPLDGVITQDDDGNVVIVPVDEVEIPLADRELDDHKCCILSFLLMLATLIIYSWFTHSMKKRQKKLAELKDQLAEETLKRQLGITDNENSAR